MTESDYKLLLSSVSAKLYFFKKMVFVRANWCTTTLKLLPSPLIGKPSQNAKGRDWIRLSWCCVWSILSNFYQCYWNKELSRHLDPVFSLGIFWVVLHHLDTCILALCTTWFTWRCIGLHDAPLVYMMMHWFAWCTIGLHDAPLVCMMHHWFAWCTIGLHDAPLVYCCCCSYFSSFSLTHAPPQYLCPRISP